MSVLCGNCKSHHGEVADVRACYAGKLALTSHPLAGPSETEPVWSERTPRGSAPTEERTPVPAELFRIDGITPKQEEFLNKLLGDRPMYRDVENLWPENVAKMSKKDATSKISEVLKVPSEVAARKSSDEGSLNTILAPVPDCYLALPSLTGNNDLDFIRVATNQGRENPANKGKRRVQRFIGGQGIMYITLTEQIKFAKEVAGLTTIELAEAMALFGREIGKCGCCGKPLTDETSRALGIGPVCRSK